MQENTIETLEKLEKKFIALKEEDEKLKDELDRLKEEFESENELKETVKE